jgi:hypothetical protein
MLYVRPSAVNVSATHMESPRGESMTLLESRDEFVGAEEVTWVFPSSLICRERQLSECRADELSPLSDVLGDDRFGELDLFGIRKGTVLRAMRS